MRLQILTNNERLPCATCFVGELTPERGNRRGCGTSSMLVHGQHLAARGCRPHSLFIRLHLHPETAFESACCTTPSPPLMGVHGPPPWVLVLDGATSIDPHEALLNGRPRPRGSCRMPEPGAISRLVERPSTSLWTGSVCAVDFMKHVVESSDVESQSNQDVKESQLVDRTPWIFALFFFLARPHHFCRTVES